MNEEANRILKTEYDLIFTEFLILVGLLSMGEVPQKELSKYSNISKGMVSRLVTRLKSKDLITINTNDKDKREDIIYLTEKGKVVAINSAESLEKLFIQYIVKDIPEKEMSVFTKTLEKLVANVNTLQKK
jgi:DNA-binding MarR family transcriptional regulator